MGSIGRPPPPLPPPSPPSPTPEYANLPRTVSFLSRNLEDNYMCEVGEAVRLELLDEKAALHQERVMKDQAATQPCSRLQATFLLQRPVNGHGVLLESCVAGTLRCSSVGWRRGRATQALARLRQR